MTIKYVLFCLCLSGCTHSTVNNSSSVPLSNKACLTDESVAQTLRLLVETYQRSVSTNDEKKKTPTLQDDQCWKRKYVIGDYTLFIYQTDISPYSVVGSMGKVHLDKTLAAECKEKALKEIKTLSIPFSQDLIDQYRRVHSKMWDDEDVGVAKWLNCQTENLVEWLSSLGTFLHEISHDVSDDHCLFSKYQKDKLCFNFSKLLPKANIARLNSYPTSNERAIEGIDFFQNLYLHENESFLTFLDEVRAYGITTFAETAALKKYNKAGIFVNVKDEKSRIYFVLPQMLNHLMIYLQALKDKEPNLFKEVVSQDNLSAIKNLVRQTENDASEWFSELKAHNLKPRDVEIVFWQQYLERKKQLDLF